MAVEIRRLFGAGAVAVAVMAVSAGARANFFRSGNQLYEDCTAGIDTVNYTRCLYYVTGVADVILENNFVAYTPCVPSGESIGQVTDVVVQYLAAHPERRHLSAAGLVADALEKAFPSCR